VRIASQQVMYMSSDASHVIYPKASKRWQKPILKDRWENVGAVGAVGGQAVQILAFPLTMHIAYTTAQAEIIYFQKLILNHLFPK